MEIDLYTKVLLTVIAVCQVWKVMRAIPPTVVSRRELRPVGIDDALKVQIVGIAHDPLTGRGWQPIEVSTPEGRDALRVRTE